MADPTPPPWRLELSPGGGFQILAPGDDPYGPVICARNAWPRNADESHANARQMHASPDLLAACRHALRFLEGRGDPFAGDDWELGHRLSAAIGKAEGGSP